MKEKLINRFKNFDAGSWVVIISMFVFFVIGLYFSIGMSITISKNMTLFGSSSYSGKEIEISPTTSSDILVVSFFWIITILLLITFIYFTFLKKIDIKHEVNNLNSNDDKNIKSDELLSDDSFINKLNQKENDRKEN